MGIGHVMSLQLSYNFYYINPGMLDVDVCSVPAKAFAHSFIIILLQVTFSESSGPLEMLDAPGKQQFNKGEILHLLATRIALFDSNIEDHLVKSSLAVSNTYNSSSFNYSKKCAWQIFCGL